MDDAEYFARIEPIVEHVARHLCRKQSVSYTATFSLEDLIAELQIKALEKRHKLEPRLEAGEDGYVFATLRNDGRDALTAERKHYKASTLEDLEEGLYSKRDRMEAGKNPDPPPIKIQRSAREGFDDAFERMRLERAAWPVCLALMGTLEEPDAEIFKFYIGTWFNPGASARSIAEELEMGESTVYRRLAKIRQRAADLLAHSDADAC